MKNAHWSAVATGAAALLLLSGCSAEPEATATPEPTAEVETTPSEAPTEESTDEAAPAASGDQPEWALPLINSGDKLGTVTAGDITVDVYQVAVEKATKTGNFVSPDDNKPIIDVGDEIVFVNYVVTNNGDPIDLGSSLVNVSSRYQDWPYMQGMDGITDFDLFDSVGIHTLGIAPGTITDPPIYTLGTGQTFDYAENFRYEAGNTLDIEVTATPVDDEGDLLHDNKVEGEGSVTLK